MKTTARLLITAGLRHTTLTVRRPAGVRQRLVVAACLAFGGCGAAASAQQPISEHASIKRVKLDLAVGLRLRGELQNNFNVKTYGESTRDEMLLQRLRIELGLRFSERLRLFVQGQDARELGSDFSNEDFPNGSPYNNRFDLRQAYLEWTRIGGTPAGVKLGRQSIALGDNRLMGPGEWGNVGRYAWDAATLTWRSAILNADLFYAFRVRHDPTSFDRRHFDYDVLGLFTTFPVKPFKLHAFYFLRMNNFPSGDAPPRSGSYRRHSPGISLEGNFSNRIDMRMGMVPQFGEWGGDPVRAVGGFAEFGYTVPVGGFPRFGLHYAYGSGDSSPGDDTDGTFDGVFGAVDKYYGRMNMFAWANLHDLQLAISANPATLLKIELDYHLFLLADKHDAWYYANGRPQRHDPGGTSGILVGSEVDLVGVINATKRTRLEVGYGVFFPGAFVHNTGPHELAHGGFLQWSYGF